MDNTHRAREALRELLAQAEQREQRLREALERLSVLGGGRSEGNYIAQDVLKAVYQSPSPQGGDAPNRER